MYDRATVFFSDIVSFTTIAARGSPLNTDTTYIRQVCMNIPSRDRKILSKVNCCRRLKQSAMLISVLVDYPSEMETSM
ncbi:hypothetical protein KIN20_024720 [Parelaphostrongylus tenuis]|uniref:Guanylate cyclase domain-containing protein n=1 Tax=Parelaphostrongylus tenuis TaxID=148309 RepID=A0AAD5N8H0_PARTN|nr:hypothetical protein KIN20_024720 [Parelaphostrongylus tenuis]